MATNNVTGIDGQSPLFDLEAIPCHDNPMVQKHGSGPKDVKCKDCKHLLYHDGVSHRYYKCGYRGDSHGPATDHRVGWAACSLFERNDIDGNA